MIRKPDILFFMETKISTVNVKNIINKNGYPNSFTVPTGGLSGGLWLIWRDSANFDVDILFSNRFIHALIKEKNKNRSEFSTFIYGCPQ